MKALLSFLLCSLVSALADVTVAEPQPKLTLEEQYGAPIRAGDFPRFRCTVKGVNLASFRVFLKKDDKVIGKIFGRWLVLNFAEGRMMQEWELTLYDTEELLRILPKAGSGYRLFFGTLKDIGKPVTERSFTTGAFSAFTETEPFTILPPAPFVIHRFNDRLDDIAMYVVGGTGTSYAVHYAPWMGAPWKEAVRFQAQGEVVKLTPAEQCVTCDARNGLLQSYFGLKVLSSPPVSALGMRTETPTLKIEVVSPLAVTAEHGER